LAFTSQGELIVAESEGSFTMEDWDEVHDIGKRLCCDEVDDNPMQDEALEEKNGGMMGFVKSVLKEKVGDDLYWKD